MAEGTIISFAKKLGVIVLEEYKFLEGVEGQVVSLRDELEWISSFLRDAAVQRSRYERVDVWVSQIRDLAYDAEDVLDIFIHKVKKLKKRNIRGLINYPGRLSTLHKLGNQIDIINKRIEKISTYRSKYAIDKLEDIVSLGKDMTFNKRSDNVVEGDDVVGFDIQSKAVAKMLLEKEDDSLQFTVISIVGMAGAGKSTLARKVYNDVKNQFDSHAWINVPHEFISESLLQNIKDQNLRNKEEDGTPIKEDMGKLLVVLDDVWGRQDWDVLHTDVLKKIKSTEIRVLLTSRYTAVATHACSRIKPYSIEKLDEEMGLELLKKKVFRKENLPDELKELAVKIVDKCHGLPLAIAVLGGLLSTKQKTIDVWTKVVQSVSWQLLQGSTECFEVVALSYDNLPNFLKPCFLYLGLFPEDSLIDCETLIQLWIAEGFIQMRGEESMEDVAEDYLEELTQRNMIQVEKRRSNGSVEICRIHDLLREFVISKGRQDKFLDILGNKGSHTCHTMSRRLAVHSTIEEDEGTIIPNISSLNCPRSMLCFDNLSNVRSLVDKSFYKSFKLLRVLDLGGAAWNLQSLPDEIGKLVLLKYLNLSGVSKIKWLPFSIRNLRNLQTLNISRTGIRGIPGSVFELEELRHFYGNTDYDSTDNEFSCTLVQRKIIDYYYHSGICGAPPQRIGRLRNLQTLSITGDNWICDDDFSQLTHLRKLQIYGVKMDRFGAALFNSIRKLIYLRELYIQWDEGKLQFQDSLSQHVHLYKVTLMGEVEKLPTDPDAFPPNLTELNLHHTALEQDEGDHSIQTLAALKKLKVILFGCDFFVGKRMVFPAEGFPNLISLDIHDLTELEEWNVGEGSLPNLKFLTLGRLRSLRELPDGLRHVTTLQKLSLIFLSDEIKRRVASDKGDDWDKIKHIPILDTSSAKSQEIIAKIQAHAQIVRAAFRFNELGTNTGVANQ
ncbi:hypothetical protein NE237_005699 [Protea cynaroides]|uniref:Disease resistance protein n=1 Tax=Protea cynaroides TaxID=273540 RepID=A0A9Q0QUR3_9MAGN|nr:hypothetical protein NE237_005699 [Protea cynaroides]